ncbi:MAG: hypothetical protein ABIJ92_04010 [Candidatus Aenigmatarchaeota archaeon]
MKKVILIVIVILIIILAVFFSGIFSSTDTLSSEEYQKIQQIINDDYEGAEIKDITPKSNCVICDDDGCNTPDDSCWKVTIEINNQERDIEIGKSGPSEPGDGSGSGDGEEETFDDCRYTYTEQGNNVTFTYYNTNCENPLPTCDTSGFCRECQSQQDCLRFTVQNHELVDDLFYDYGIIDEPDFHGIYNEENQQCIIDVLGIEVLDDFITKTECESIIYTYISCNSGLCQMV